MSHSDGISSHLPLYRLGQVDSCTACEVVPLWKPRDELRGNLGTDFKTAHADSRPDGDNEIFRTGSELFLHGLDCLWDDARQGSAPSGVNGGNGFICWIRQKDRKAVGSSDGQRDSWLVSDEGIAFADASGVIRNKDFAGMNLPQRRQAVYVRPAGSKPRTEAVLEPRKFIQ